MYSKKVKKTTDIYQYRSASSNSSKCYAKFGNDKVSIYDDTDDNYLLGLKNFCNSIDSTNFTSDNYFLATGHDNGSVKLTFIGDICQ